MNIRAEKAFLVLPRVIDQIDQGIIYTFQYGFESIPEDLRPDKEFVNFKIDLTYLIDHYLERKLITQEQKDMFMSQIYSPDKENWLIAFMLIDNLKHKLWNPNKN